MEREEVRVPASPTRCPWCKGDIEDVKQVVACAACGARHHGSCHQENGRCATCGATDVLVPRAPAPSLARVKREAPPKGSIITVEKEGDALVYSWPLRETSVIVLSIFFLLTVLAAPLALWFLYRYFKNERARLRVSRDEIEFQRVSGLGQKTVRARREDVGAIRATAIGPQAVSVLQIDVGVDRWTVKTGILPQSALRPLELEWLAQALEGWKNEA